MALDLVEGDFSDGLEVLEAFARKESVFIDDGFSGLFFGFGCFVKAEVFQLDWALFLLIVLVDVRAIS